MKMSKKSRKDCLGCFCYEGTIGTCQLHYSIKHKSITPGIGYHIPTEPCPKPRTGSEWSEARKYYRKY